MSSGVITFKVSYDGDMHRFSISEKDATIEELNKTIKMIFELEDISQFKKKYEDPEGDLITLKTNFDLQEAIRIALHNKNAIRLMLIPSQENSEETKNEEPLTEENDINTEESNKTDETENNVHGSDPVKSFMYLLGKSSLENISETLQESQYSAENILNSVVGQSSEKRRFRIPEDQQNRFLRDHKSESVNENNEIKEDSKDRDSTKSKGDFIPRFPNKEREPLKETFQYNGKYVKELEQLKQMGFPPDICVDILESCKGNIEETVDKLAKTM